MTTTDGFAGWGRDGHLLPEALTRWPDGIEAWFARGSITIKEDRHTTIRVVQHDDSTPVFVKRFEKRGPRPWFRLKRGSLRAVVAFHAAEALQRQGVPVPTPLACLCRHRRLLVTTFALWEHVGGAVSLAEWVRHHPDWRERMGTWDTVATCANALRSMHACGYSHGDTKWSNLLVDPETGTIRLVDLDGAVPLGLGRSRAVCKDLARFVADLRRFGGDPLWEREFLLVYTAGDTRDADHWARSIEARAARIVRRHMRQAARRPPAAQDLDCGG